MRRPERARKKCFSPASGVGNICLPRPGTPCGGRVLTSPERVKTYPKRKLFCFPSAARHARCHLLRARRAAGPAASAVHAALGRSAGRAELDADVSRLPWQPLPAWWDIFSDGTSTRTQMPGMFSAAVCLPLLHASRTPGLLRAAERDGEGGDWAAREGEGTEGCCEGSGCREEHRVGGSGQGSRNGGTRWPAVTKRIRDGRGVLGEDRCSI